MCIHIHIYLYVCVYKRTYTHTHTFKSVPDVAIARITTLSIGISSTSTTTYFESSPGNYSRIRVYEFMSLWIYEYKRLWVFEFMGIWVYDYIYKRNGGVFIVCVYYYYYQVSMVLWSLSLSLSISVSWSSSSSLVLVAIYHLNSAANLVFDQALVGGGGSNLMCLMCLMFHPRLWPRTGRRACVRVIWTHHLLVTFVAIRTFAITSTRKQLYVYICMLCVYL